jgi:hypothetical protein
LASFDANMKDSYAGLNIGDIIDYQDEYKGLIIFHMDGVETKFREITGIIKRVPSPDKYE